MPSVSPNFLLLTRIGFAARGLLYLLVGFLALRLGRIEEAGGAMRWLRGQAGGMVLGALAFGFAAYGAWRLFDALLDTQHKGRDLKGAIKRLAGGGSGLIHLGLAYSAVKLALGGSASGNASDRAEGGAAMAMRIPGGEALLWAAAAILAIAAIAQFGIAVRRSYCKHLTAEARNRWWAVAAGSGGHAARGAIFLFAAWLALRAGLDHEAAEAGALGDALRTMPGALRVAVAAGLCLFGAYSLIEARYRIIPEPRVKRRVADALA
ncbi:MAG: hypothetical protein QOJ27_2339 [Sphingomonadales bacterium]|nr:hypothetical protein [Sphingomonadales bacterium]